MPNLLITESWLRESFGLGPGTEVHLPLDCELTAAAQQLLAERQIRVKYSDDAGRIFAPDKLAETPLPIHPLTGRTRDEEAKNPSRRKDKSENHETLTHLDAHTLVAKNHPRIALRGKLDTLISFAVLAQSDFDRENRYPWLRAYLADIRSHMGNLLRDEVTGAEAQPITLGGASAERIHAISHNPLKYLGHDHIVPEKAHGRDVALLNVLRALAREVEVEVANNFMAPDLSCSRPDLLMAANRLSSALYVLMLLTALAGEGKKLLLEEIVLE